ncbi:MAG TPA: diguanylate cyclase [Acidobacteriaceae bacterium]|nr:diguanylate cyclase [Acidobacteriaceae bacterium]
MKSGLRAGLRIPGLLILGVLILGCLRATGAEAVATLTTIPAVHNLTHAEASQGIPVDLEGVVTYYSPKDVDLFLQQNGEGLYVQTAIGQNLQPGDRIQVKGKTRDSFRTDILADSVTFLGHGSLPPPVEADFTSLITAKLDCLRVTVHAVVRSADIVRDAERQNLYMHLAMDGGSVDASLVGYDGSQIDSLIDAEVELTGVVAGRFDSKNQMIGTLLELPDKSSIRIVSHAVAAPESLPLTPMDEVLSGYHVRDQSRRIRVRGTVTYYEPGSAVVLQNGSKSLWINTQYEEPVKIGVLADVTGFPNAENRGSLTMSLGKITQLTQRMPIAPRPVTEQELAVGSYEFSLIMTQGRVLTTVHGAAQDEYVLSANGHVFPAVVHHMDGAFAGTMKDIPEGATVQVTGISMVSYGSNPYQGPVSFSVLMRSFDDISVVANPSWITVRNLAWLIGALVLVLLAFGIRQWKLERKVHRQTVTLATRSEAKAELERRTTQLEQRRSRILEEINGVHPLAEILERIAGLVSYMLNERPCWCEVVDGATLGGMTAQVVGGRVWQEEIRSHTGQTLGRLLIAADGSPMRTPEENEALAEGSRLAALAIETRRIYTDLVYRSEFDQLTSAHNRFSLDKHLDLAIDEARKKASIFGLIYIDLDKFKQVNDRYGHQAGDLYLREVAARMSRQLRPGDVLARLGGDEFAVLVPVVRSRSEVKEIADRLERIFDEPFLIDSYLLHGSASIGMATYPEDGTSKDSMLSAADAAMYVGKQTRSEDGLLDQG